MDDGKDNEELKNEISKNKKLLEDAWENAYSIERMDGHEAEGRDVEFIGIVEKKRRIYMMYKDNHGDFWYRTMIKTKDGIISEEKAIFKNRRDENCQNLQLEL